MDRNDGGPRFDYGHGSHFDHLHGQHPFAWLVCFVLVVALISLAVWLLLRSTGRLSRVQGVAAVAGAGSDGALETVRLRYARGEIDRDAFQQLSADLGGAPPEPPPV